MVRELWWGPKGEDLISEEGDSSIFISDSLSRRMFMFFVWNLPHLHHNSARCPGEPFRISTFPSSSDRSFDGAGV